MLDEMVETLPQHGIINFPEDVDDPELLVSAVEYGNLKIVEDLLKNGANVNIEDTMFYRSILHAVVRKDKVQMAKLLINYGANVNITDVMGKAPIVDAIKNRNKEMIELLLTNGANTNNNPKLLRIAVENGNLEIVEDLLKNGADINMLKHLHFRESLLHRAVVRKQVEMVKLLIKHGANLIVNVKNHQGDTPIVDAIRNRDKKMIKLLLNNGADINNDPKVLRAAVENGNLEIVEDLLKNGADINMLKHLHFRKSLLHRAVVRKQVEMVKLLIKHGANLIVNVKNHQGNTPIVYAIRNRDKEMIKLLLTNAADIKEDPKVLYTAVKNGNLKIVEDILTDCADVNMLLEAGSEFGSWSPLLHKAVKGKQVQMTKLLLNYGADVNIKDDMERTPIVDAIQNRDKKMIKLLLNNGADINNDPEVLGAAVENGTLEIVEDLLKNGADVNMLLIANSKVLPLNKSVLWKQVQMAKLLINYGANVNVKDIQGTTPIFHAINRRHTEMIELLLMNGADIKEDPKVLYTAVKNGNLKIVEDILTDCADVNMLLKASSQFVRLSPLLHEAVKGKQVQMTKLLLNYGADVNIKDVMGRTPVVDAIENRNKEMIELILNNGADIKKDPKVLRAAVENGNLKIVEDILTDGVDVNMLYIANSKVLPLHKAVMQKELEMAELLIKYGANVNAKDSEGATPIFHAINRRDTEMIELLLMNGADIKFHPNKQCAKRSTTKLFKQHIAKVTAAGLYVSERNFCWISRDSKISHFLDECDAEVQIMKRKKIDNSCASFYDILTKDTSKLAKNESIVKTLKSDDYKTEFPIYASTIDSRFRRGVEREELLEQVRNKFLPSLFKSLNELPFLCTEKIFSYLSDKDLRILLATCKLFNK